MNARAAVLAVIDAANAADPNTVEWEGRRRPRAQLQGELASAWLARLRGDASDALAYAVRAHHIRRWTVERDDYPAGRSGYLRWRHALKQVHADALGEVLAPLGLPAASVGRARQLVSRAGLGTDPEAQTVEDCACLVFLQTQYAELLERIVDDDRAEVIVRKTLAKMSPAAIALAGAVPVGDRGAVLLARSTARP